MRVRGKFFIQNITLHPGKDAGGVVKLAAVSRGDRNKDWSKWSPSGTIEMTINNPPALQQFVDMLEASRADGYQPEVFVDFTHSTDGWPGDGHKFRPVDAAEGEYLHGMCGECGLPPDGNYSGKRAHPEETGD